MRKWKIVILARTGTGHALLVVWCHGRKPSKCLTAASKNYNYFTLCYGCMYYVQCEHYVTSHLRLLMFEGAVTCATSDVELDLDGRLLMNLLCGGGVIG